MENKSLKICLLITVLASTSSYAQDYVLNESLFKSNVMFEKIPSDANVDNIDVFKLVKKDDGSYLFKKKMNNGNGNNIGDVNNYYAFGKVSGLDNAKSKCSSYGDGNKSWHLIKTDDLNELKKLEHTINSNILSFFDSANTSWGEYWVDSSDFYKNDPERPVNTVIISTDNNKFNYNNWIEEDSFQASVVCVSD
ncbi:hypothetical protein [Photobacterium damselae]|uniref:hypothetical protein n=1 Tax=Photobacterium damselae TaxID=38293 RepID=UPI0040692950